MKKLVFLFVLLCSVNITSKAQSILAKPKVDERIELTSIVFRLAEAREYSSTRFPLYVERINKHFDAFKDHPLIAFIKTELRQVGIGYDAVASMAINLTAPPELKPLTPFSEKTPESRWSETHATQFVQLLKQFYDDTDCRTFFKDNQDIYQLASKRFNKVYEELDLNWYKQFYGEDPKGIFTIVNAIGNGGSNYGPGITRPDGTEVFFAIMGTWSVDDDGMPQYPVKRYFPTLLHEFNHSFVNHVVEKFHNELTTSGEAIYTVVREKMENQAYSTWQTMYAEAVVRAAVIKYLIDHEYEEKYVQSELYEEINRGFIWTKDLVAELDRFDKNRDQFPSLESFMPELVKFFNQIAVNINALDAKWAAARPKVTRVVPINKSGQKIDPAITEIIVYFDKPLAGEGYSIYYGKQGAETFPEFGEIEYTQDKKAVRMEVKLEAGKAYEFILVGRGFKSEEGLGMEDYTVRFETK